MKHARLALLAAAITISGAANAYSISSLPAHTHVGTITGLDGVVSFSSTFKPPHSDGFVNESAIYTTNLKLEAKTLLGYWTLHIASDSDIAATAVSATGGNAQDIGTNPNDGTITLSRDKPADLNPAANSSAASGLAANDLIYLGLFDMKGLVTKADPTHVHVVLTSYDK
ncbi:hypothetical protein RBV54_004849 [Salmonella enterica]|nr:hypothetical protein [Salmonella enterica]ELF7042694.1 hypothetical protein [Salmonella enterica]